MLPRSGRYLCLKLFLTIVALQRACDADGPPPITKSKANLVQRISSVLGQLKQVEELSVSTKFGALLGEFLIKQKVRFVEPTRYEEQIFYHMLRSLDVVLRKALNLPASELQHEILDYVFQRNVRLRPQLLKYGQLDANLEYDSLAQDYELLVGNGFPNKTTSDLCLAAIATLDGCKLNDICLYIIVTDEPTYGYQRMHQILLLYVLLHHNCAPTVGAPLDFDALASARCTQAYREQNVIRSWGIPNKYRDLYLEQIAICGLFGYNEYVNWRNVVELSSWPNKNGCICNVPAANETLDCSCNTHINNLALVYYINAFVLLN